MAVTKIIPIRVTIEKSIDYICNPKKTDGQFYIHSEHCVPQTAALTFQHHLNQARAGGNTIGRHLIQSFAPGEVSPETAHEIGKRLAGEILGGKYAYVMATHVDRGHIHNHFVWALPMWKPTKSTIQTNAPIMIYATPATGYAKNTACRLSCPTALARALPSTMPSARVQAGKRNSRR